MKKPTGRFLRQLSGASPRVALAISIGAGVVGCASSSENRPRPLQASSFYTPEAASQTPSDAPAQPGPAKTGTGFVLQGQAAQTTSSEPASPHISEVVRQQVKLDRPVQVTSVSGPSAPTLQLPTSSAQTATDPLSPSTASAVEPTVGASSGHYLIFGGIIAKVNDRPIYSNKVVSLIEKPLKAKAKDLPPQQFEALAMDLISKQVRELVTDELEFAAADRFLEENDKNLATALTMKWRDDQIVSAGGSVELARKRAQADDQDFDDQVRQQYRTELVQIYYQKEVFPKIQVSAEDIRHYYAANVEKMFTQHDQARFRLVKIGVEETGTRELALKKAWNIHDRAVAGEDFAVMAARENDDLALRKSKGLIAGENEMIQRGAFVLDKVDEAVWMTGEGHVTDVIDNGNAFYVAKVEKLDRGSVKPFESDVIQDQIRNELRSAQFRVLREQAQAKNEQGATLLLTPEMMNLALDMVMQKYAQWSVR